LSVNLKAGTPAVIRADVHEPDEAAWPLQLQMFERTNRRWAVVVLLAGDLPPVLPVSTTHGFR
jgi:hypothetical protein